MTQELKAIALMMDGQSQCESFVRDFPSAHSEFPAPFGTDNAPSSLELFLMSLCTCVGGAVSHILRKSKAEFTGLSIKAEAARRTEHPTFFKSIELNILLESMTVTGEELNEAILLAESDISPVWNMIKDTVPVTYSCAVNSGADSH